MASGVGDCASGQSRAQLREYVKGGSRVIPVRTNI